jgi:hypothetical protein
MLDYLAIFVASFNFFLNHLTCKKCNRLMEHGLLSPERAKKAYEKKQKRQQQIRLGTPIKPTVRKDKLGSSKTKQVTSSSMDSKAKKRVDYSDDDFIVKMKRTKG